MEIMTENLFQIIANELYGTEYSRVDQVKFVEGSL